MSYRIIQALISTLECFLYRPAGTKSNTRDINYYFSYHILPLRLLRNVKLHKFQNGSEDLVCALREDEDHGDYEFETVCKNGKFIDTGDESRKTIMMSPEDDGELSTHYYVVAVNNFEWHDVSDTMVAINYPHNPLRSYYSAFLHLDSTKTPDRSWIVACFSPKRGWKTVDKMATLTFKDDKEFQDIVKMC